MLDVVIRGGEVVDGTGTPRTHADVGIRDGQVVAIGDVDERARRTIDATGRIVAPGFIDVHTHYDAQAFWDPTLSPSPLHGVTTALAGNCGFSIAPLDDSCGPQIMQMLARVEGMPLESLEAGVPWDWRSTAEYLDRLDGRLAINTGFSVGHSAIRRVAMGDAAVERAATADELETMCALLRDGLAAGGIGFSSSWAPTHNEPDGRPVPSRLASADELVALSAVCGEFPGTSLEFIPNVGPFTEVEIDLMTRMSLAAARPLNWNAIFVVAETLPACLAKLEAGTYARERGAKVIALTCPYRPTITLSFLSGVGLDALPDWDSVMTLPREEKLAALSDPGTRHRLAARADTASVASVARLYTWSTKVIAETFTPETKQYEGRTVGEIAEQQGKDPFDALLDIACADGLRTTFLDVPAETAEDWRSRVEIWKDDRVVIGASDAGAHLDMIATFNITTAFLAQAVREHELLPLEEAVRLITDAPARLYGLRGRGRLAEGAAADVVVFDPDVVAPERVTTRFDLPGGAGRLYAGAVGIDRVLVNGDEIVTSGEFSEARPGRMLRSGVDTETPSMVVSRPKEGNDQ